jgi:hypothetical protein
MGDLVKESATSHSNAISTAAHVEFVGSYHLSSVIEVNTSDRPLLTFSHFNPDDLDVESGRLRD